MPRAAVPRADPWTTAIRAGDFAQAWQISDRDLAAICRAGPAKHQGPRHQQRIWRGEPLAGRRVLVRCYHGLGDTIQFARFLPPLRRIAREVVAWCQPELQSLIGTVSGVDLVLPLHEGTPDVEFDVDIEIMEIPHAIRASREQAALSRPYLEIPRNVDTTEIIDSRTYSVGLVWDVGDWDRRRMIPPQLLEPLADTGAQLYSLQRGASRIAAAEIGAIDISTPDILQLAERLRSLDLCICPDTMAAHLSAAMGRKTWIMLPAECDWRWPASGRETFWYPTARLFHQETAGDWSSVVAEIRSALRDEVVRHSASERLLQRRADIPSSAGRTAG
jgi:hypothetical protein